MSYQSQPSNEALSVTDAISSRRGKLSTNFTFNANAKTLTINDTDYIKPLYVANNTRGAVLFNPTDTSTSGVVSGAVITLNRSTSGMSDSDELTVLYEADELNSVVLSDILTELLAQGLTLDSTLAELLAQGVVQDSQLIELLAQGVTLDSTLTELLAQGVVQDSELAELIAQGTTLDSIETEQLAQGVVQDSQAVEQLAQGVVLDEQKIEQINNSFLLENILIELKIANLHLRAVSGINYEKENTRA